VRIRCIMNSSGPSSAICAACHISSSCRCVRVLHINILPRDYYVDMIWSNLSDNSASFAKYTHLRVIRLHGEYMPVIDKFLVRMPSVSELDIHWLSQVPPHAMKSIAQALPSLRILRLGAGTAWCGLCNLSCSLLFPSPVSITYGKGYGLPVSILVNHGCYFAQICLAVLWKDAPSPCPSRSCHYSCGDRP
jgi:hypothetical protein